jgi:hypothetical protein
MLGNPIGQLLRKRTQLITNATIEIARADVIGDRRAVINLLVFSPNLGFGTRPTWTATSITPATIAIRTASTPR